MPRGPLPNPDRRRTNAPTIPTTHLPSTGRSGPVPRPPSWVNLDKAGKGWWAWAWKTPQAAGWSVGDLAMIARRAGLEDDLSYLADVKGLDALAALGMDDSELVRLVRGLAPLATGKLQILREMRELDDRLGLTPKGMAQLRWKIVDTEPESKPAGSSITAVANLDDRRARLTGA